MNHKVNLFLNRLQEQNLSLALAESITCGLAAHQLSTATGTSNVLKGSIVCYTEEVKTTLLKVPQKLIDRHTAESMQVTEALARNLRRLIKADIYGAVTGLASPGGSETKTKPVGTVFFCVKHGRKLFKKRKVFRGTPTEVRKKACLELYAFITKKILLA
jgi:nicotinamide-nucleotide amidase